MNYKTLFFKTLGVYLVSSYTINAQKMQFERFYDETLAQASYIIANDKNEAIVIDPKRDIDTYLDYAKQNGLTINFPDADIPIPYRYLQISFSRAERCLCRSLGKGWAKRIYARLQSGLGRLQSP